MLTYQRLEQELSVKLAQLPATKWQDALDFVNFLVYQRTSRIKKPSVASGEPYGADPLEAFVGAVAHGALAQEIDEAVCASSRHGGASGAPESGVGYARAFCSSSNFASQTTR